KIEHQTGQEPCHYPRAPAESLLVTPKDSTKALRIFILTRPKPLARAGQARKRIHWLFIFRIHGMDCWACASSTVLSNQATPMANGQNVDATQNKILYH